MAWNEPGGNNNNDKDPWGNDQGPPDLDEALKKLQEKLNGIFGGKGGSGGGSSGGGGGISGALVGVVLAGALLVWGLLGFYQVDEQERAVDHPARPHRPHQRIFAATKVMSSSSSAMSWCSATAS